MEQSTKNKLSFYLILTLGVFIISFFAGGCFVTLLDPTKEFTFANIISGMFSGTGTTASFAIFAIGFLFVILSKNSKGKTMKGKEKMENVRFLTPKELDKTFDKWVNMC